MADVNVPDRFALPSDLPAPQDDGAARHLSGKRLPDIALAATDGTMVSLAAQKGRTVVYLYPRTGEPGTPVPKEWDAIPGARGCTPQSCGFRDHFADLQRLGVARLYGLSTQDTAYQREAVERLHLPFAILSDADLKLTRALDLPTFTFNGMTLMKRMAWVVDDGVITKVFYPVFPPDQNAAEVIAWLSGEGAAYAAWLRCARTAANTLRNISGVSTPVFVFSREQW
jgi:peroxiredoxin